MNFLCHTKIRGLVQYKLLVSYLIDIIKSLILSWDLCANYKNMMNKLTNSVTT